MPAKDSASSGNNKRNGAPWWVELIRREGVLAILILGYGYFILVPESRARTEAIAAQTQLVAELSQSDKQFSDVLEKMRKLLEKADVDHQRMAKKLGCE